jgi:tetratricopeptide (TPR) repeat protein
MQYPSLLSIPLKVLVPGFALAALLAAQNQPPTQSQGPQQGQQGPPQGGQQQPGPGRQQQPGIPGQDRTLGRDQRDPFPTMEQQRVIYLSGKVMLDDGTPPPEPVVIERVCNGVPRPEGYTDSKGRFSFQLGQNNNLMPDASYGSSEGFGGLGGPGGRQSGMGPGGFGRGGVSERDLAGCELRASLAGFRSDVVNLMGRRAMDNPDVGTIVLHRLAKVDGFTFSATTAYAPKDAQKAYKKGQEANKKKKFEDAEKHLTKAVTQYDKYAVAWYELGTVYQQQSKMEEAKNAYNQSIKADAKLITPYAQLTRLAATEQKWQEAADLADKVIRLNPYFSSDIYFMSSVANLNLRKINEAEEHAREALKMDAQHRNPKISHVLGIILAQKRDFTGAAENIRDYLKYAPKAEDAEQVKQQLAEIERMTGKQEAAQTQPTTP